MPSSPPTYIRAPTLTTAPDGPIVLGNIIISANVPDEPENDQAPATIPNLNPPHIDYNSGVGASEFDRQSGGILASFLSITGVGGDVTGRHGTTSSQKFTIKELETQEFKPSKKYIEHAVRDPAVMRYITSGTFRRKHVYMITGVKIARGASAVIKHMKRKGLHLQVGVNTTAAGVPLEVGPKLDVSSGSEMTVSFDNSTDFVLAYRLCKIVVSRKDTITSKEYTKGAFLNTKPARYEEEVPDVHVEEVLDETDTIKELHPQHIIYDDDGDEAIGYVVLSED
jgi:hypothetical protein